ncbi:MAG: adenylate/guanylate cyclase domain-containing protein, partial [Candidatus Tectomicrobia bacterium]|nr:adenylate/guanylate cyclase domain-containing protein [Candidatus Tectomicrobia bacterium]
LATLFMVLLYLSTSQSILMRNLEAKALDLRFQLRGVRSPGPQVALVLVDDKSIAELGRWPWSRDRFGEIVKRLKEGGAKVIAFDLLFTEKETNIELDFLRTLKATFESLGLSTLDPKLETFHQTLMNMEETIDPDLKFAAALQEAGNVILAFSMAFEPSKSWNVSPQNPPPSFVARSAYRSFQNLRSEKPSLPLIGIDILLPIEEIGQSAKILAHVNLAFDTDGTPRYEFPVVEYQEEYYPSFALQVAREYLGFKLEEVKVQFGEGIQLGNIFIPTDESMRMLVNYYGPPGTFPTYSLADVLQGRLPDSTFRDKIVLIGGAAVGLGDTFVTPFSTALPGVERHANIIESILREDFLVRRDSTGLIDLFFIALPGLLLGLLSSKLPSFWGNLFALGLAGFYLVVNLLTFTHEGLWVNLLFPFLAIMLNQSAITLFKFLTEEKQKRMIRRAFQYYLHPSVVDQVSSNPQLLKLGGEEKELTVLFSDIRSFSTISERLTPEELVHLLNEYLTAMTRIVLNDNGLLDKYIGDAIMAVYGAPLPTTDHAYQACHTALDMMAALKELQKSWGERGLPLINIGIGINTAMMVVGNMGSDLRFDYTVMGDGVNLASRLEGVNKEYKTNIIIGESTWVEVKDRIATRELDVIQVKGKEKPTRIFEVVGFHPLSHDQTVKVTLFEEGIHAYRVQQWEKAIRLFQQTLEKAPGDFPGQLYIHRCQEFMADPPPRDWDGVYIMKTK